MDPALRFSQGLAGAAGVVVARAVVRDLVSGPELVRSLSRLMLVVGVVPVLAPTVGGMLLDRTSWRGLFVVVLAVVGAVLTVVLVGLRRGAASALLGVLQFAVGGALAPLVGLAGSARVLPLAGLMAARLLGSLLVLRRTGRTRSVLAAGVAPVAS